MKTKAHTATTAMACLLLTGVSTPALAQSTCQNVGGHISGTIVGPDQTCGGALTEVGSFTGQPGGTFVACVTNVQQRGDGVVVFDLVHTYTLSTDDAFFTTDHVVASPIAPPIYRINNRAHVTGGTGLYEGASGFLRDHGTVRFVTAVTGVVEVDYRGRICTTSPSSAGSKPTNSR